MHSIKVVVVERKQHDLAEKKLQKANSKWNEDKIKQLDYINQRLCQKKKKKKEKHISTKLFLPLEPHLKDLNDPSKKKKRNMVSYYLLHWIQNWQHTLFSNILSKWQGRN